MRGFSSIILLAFATRAEAEYEQNRYADGLTDKFLDALAGRTSQPSSIGANLDQSVLGKAAQLATPAVSRAAGSNLKPLFPIRAQALSSMPSRTCSCPAQRGHGNLAPLAVLGSQALQPAHPSIQTHSLPVTARAEASPERTYVMVKPDGVQRGLVGEIISRFENKGFTLKGLKLFSCPEDLAKEHYGDLSAKPFFQDLVDYICSGPVVAMVWEGKGVVKSARKLIGATNPLESEPGTIRGDFAVEVGRNVIHGSDSIDNGEREIKLWFSSGEGTAEWTPAMEPWLRE